MIKRASYPSDLTDKQWVEVAPLILAVEPGGRDREVAMREVLNGILYLVRGGVSWRMLPHDLPPWGTVHYYHRRFRLDGTWVENPRCLAWPGTSASRAQSEPVSSHSG